MSGTMDDTERLRQGLPWLVNGSLPPADREELERALPERPELRAERAFLDRIRTAVREEEGASPGELGWRRLRQRIEAEPRSVGGAPSATAHGWWRPMAIAASVLFAVQTIWIWGPGREEAGYQPLGAPPTAQTIDTARLQVRFTASAGMGEIQDLLTTLEAQIVSGPSASGVYRVEVARHSLDDTLSRLRAMPALVEQAQPE
jgi:hypothetical protein